MSTRLLLDEMFHPHVAAELNARGHDCVAVVAQPDLREISDAELLAHALHEDRTLVTNNVVDFERLRRDRAEAAQLTPPLIYTSDTAFPRDRRFIGRMVAALDRACTEGAVVAAGGLLWLQPDSRPA